MKTLCTIAIGRSKNTTNLKDLEEIVKSVFLTCKNQKICDNLFIRFVMFSDVSGPEMYPFQKVKYCKRQSISSSRADGISIGDVISDGISKTLLWAIDNCKVGKDNPNAILLILVSEEDTESQILRSDLAEVVDKCFFSSFLESFTSIMIGITNDKSVGFGLSEFRTEVNLDQYIEFDPLEDLQNIANVISENIIEKCKEMA